MKPGSSLWLDRTPWWWGLNSREQSKSFAINVLPVTHSDKRDNEGVIRSLYLATPFQIPDDVLKGKIGFVFAFVKRSKILSILGKT